jgi:hypothetical protein
MRRYVHQYQSGVWIDACEAHGIWLDAGELEQLEAFAEASRRGGIAVGTGNANVGTSRPRVASLEHTSGPDRSFTGSMAGGIIDLAIGGGVFEKVGGAVDTGRHLHDLRRHDQEADTRAQALVEQARRDAAGPSSAG